MENLELRAKFIAKEQKYAVPEIELNISFNSSVEELNRTVNLLLNADALPGNHIKFDFEIGGQLLRETLVDHLKEKGTSKDEVVEIEYYEKLPAPSVGEWLLHDDWIKSVETSLDNLILTGCYDGCAQLWTSEGKLMRIVPAHTNAIKSVTWLKGDDDSEKRFVTASDDGSCIMWSWKVTEKEMKKFRGIDGENTKDLGELKSLHTYRMPTFEKESQHYLDPRNVEDVTASPDKTLFASGSWDSFVNIWSANPSMNESQVNEEISNHGKKKRKIDGAFPRLPIRTLEGSDGHTRRISGVEWISNEKVCSCSHDHSIRFWDIHTAQMVSSIVGSNEFFDISYSPLNQTIVASSMDRHIRLYDPRITSGSVIKSTFTSHTNWVSCVSWCPNNENLFLSGSYDCLTKLWDTRSPKAPLYDMRGHNGIILCCDWTVPSLMLSGGADKKLRIFNKV